MKRIICVGNRYVAEDRCGPAVYDRLSGRALPDDVELIDGGLGGLRLLALVDGAEQVVFVDAVDGLGEPAEVVVLEAARAAELAPPRFGHEAGLGYLLRCLPAVCEEPVPRVQVVGIEAPATEAALERAARLSLELLGCCEDGPARAESRRRSS